MKEALDWIAENWFEIAAAMVSITYVILGILQIRWLWWFGLLSAIMYSVVYGTSGFYAGMGLQGYYAFISLYGWYKWSKEPAAHGSDASALKVTHLRWKLGIVLAAIFLLVWAGIYWLLVLGTDSTVPFWDSLISAGGIVATWMLARKILEHWLVWIVLDAISIGVYAWQELYATTVLFAVYVITATIGYFQWKKSMQ